VKGSAVSLSLVEDRIRARLYDGYPTARLSAGDIAVDAVEICADELRQHAARCEGDYKQALLDAAALLQGT
jgi:hypothetical protein